jgi:NitT/TauT family transport system substrate-binding protein
MNPRPTPQRPSRANFLAASSSLVVGAGAAIPGSLLAPQIALAQNVTSIRLGAGKVEANAQAYYADAQGFFKKVGLDVQVVTLRSGTTIAAAIIGGDLQCGVSNLVSLGAAHAKGLPFVLIAGGALYDSAVPNAGFVVAPNSPIKTAKDLIGKTVGGLSVGGLDQLAFDAWLDKNGVDYTSVRFIEIAPSAMAEALALDRVQAASIADPELAVEAPRLKFLAKGWDAIAPVFMQTAWFTTQEWLAKNKDAAKRFNDAMVMAAQWGMANPEAGAAVLAKALGYGEPRARMHYALKNDVGLIQPLFDATYKYKLSATLVKANEFVWDGK